MRTQFYLLILSFLLLGCISNKDKRFERQIGTYVLDTLRSTFDSTSLKSNDYKDLIVTFYPDSTFLFSRSVPFIWDSSGTWYVGDDDLYELAYMNYIRPKDSNAITSTFYSYNPTESNSMMMNSTTPKSNEYFIQELYFIKIDSLIETQP